MNGGDPRFLGEGVNCYLASSLGCECEEGGWHEIICLLCLGGPVFGLLDYFSKMVGGAGGV